MTVRIDAGAKRPSLRKLAIFLLTCAAVIGTMLRPGPAEAVAPKDLTPVWEPGTAVEPLVPGLSPELAAGFATTSDPRQPEIELAAVTTASADRENVTGTAPLGFGGQMSGLPWASGSNAGVGFGPWRGRPQDVFVSFSGRSSWDDVRRVPTFASTRRYASMGRLSLGLAMLMNSERYDFASCLAGAKDEHIRAVARGLVASGAGDAVIRLGWEMNGKGFPWSLGNVPHLIPQYRQCFMRMASIIRAEAPDMLIEWTPRKATDPRIRLEALYPGDEYVDVVGLLYYDWWPASPTDADWNRNIVERDRHGGPKGLATWLEFARDRGKPLAVAEWGIGKHGTMNPFDNPLFIRNMFRFFQENASDIAYEAYFNSLTHKIYSASGELVSTSANSGQMYLGLYRP